MCTPLLRACLFCVKSYSGYFSSLCQWLCNTYITSTDICLLLPLPLLSIIGVGHSAFSQRQGEGIGAPLTHVNYHPQVGLPPQPGTRTGRLVLATIPCRLHLSPYVIIKKRI